MTVDYMAQVPILGTNLATPPYQSRGKREPFAGATQIQSGNPANSPVRYESPSSWTQEQNSPDTHLTNWHHTFGQTNVPTQGALSKYDWLAVHLDRQVVSPMELLFASAYPPFQLTQRFIDPSSGSTVAFGHMAPWFDKPGAL